MTLRYKKPAHPPNVHYSLRSIYTYFVTLWRASTHILRGCVIFSGDTIWLRQFQWCNRHYNDVIMSTMASQITCFAIVYSTVYCASDQENIKTPRHWPLCGEFTCDQWIPRTKGQQCGKCFPLMTSSCTNNIVRVNLLHESKRNDHTTTAKQITINRVYMPLI